MRELFHARKAGEPTVTWFRDASFGSLRRLNLLDLEPIDAPRKRAAGYKERPQRRVGVRQHLTLPICNQIHANVRVPAPNPDIVSAGFRLPNPPRCQKQMLQNPPAHVRSILILQTKLIGDLVLACPLARNLRLDSRGRPRWTSCLSAAPMNGHLPSASSPRPLRRSSTSSGRCLLAVLGQARLFLGNESGPMHMAAAAGRAVVGLFGLTDRPSGGLSAWPVLRRGAPCPASA
ncbi:glycosyltransferase family 9 protein [Mesorhizobium sp. M0601]|uniref:glycosyltransferase family 9 protein n=1 Tax=Mesorhizobium sp. M0601 TaxID=2956969 RepID=UPI00333B91A8